MKERLERISGKLVKRIFLTATCIMVFGIVGVSAANLIASSEVSYDNANSGATGVTVQDAIDELYQKADTSNNVSLPITIIKTTATAAANSSISLSFINQEYTAKSYTYNTNSTTSSYDDELIEVKYASPNWVIQLKQDCIVNGEEMLSGETLNWKYTTSVSYLISKK